mgnify:CR=1 FL=1
MCRHGENIYKRKDGRYEGRYIVGKTDEGKTRFGYVYGYQYMEVRRKLAEHMYLPFSCLVEYRFKQSYILTGYAHFKNSALYTQIASLFLFSSIASYL